MQTTKNACIKKVAVHIPTNFVSSMDMAEYSCVPESYLTKKLGINKKCTVSQGTSSTDLALIAARKIMEGEDPNSIDLVIWTGTGKKDHNTWSASAFLINQLSLPNAWGFDLFAQSACDVIALRLAKSIIESQGNVKNILIVGGHKLSQLVDYTIKATSFLMNFSDGASSVLIGIGSSNSILGSATFTDGSFAKDVLLEQRVIDGALESEKFAFKGSNTFKEDLTSASIDNYCKVIMEAKTSSQKIGSIEFLGINHLSPNIHGEILERLRIPLSKSRYLSNYGHVGAADPWISLGLAEHENALKPDSIVCVASAGLGYTWSATCINWTSNIIEFV